MYRETIFAESYEFEIPTDPELSKSLRFFFSCGVLNKKCCAKFKKGKRCKKCPATLKK